ncbi:MAG: hypothetical protein DRO67_01640 [Candidatus Asgardarchaeum californiense]|nr:MAG: hypothetical protein DRO67_01640 [Candidatus Asgardarchaeum californiense]
MTIIKNRKIKLDWIFILSLVGALALATLFLVGICYFTERYIENTGIEYYNRINDSVHCRYFCIHEVGHKLDFALGRPSNSYEFSQDVAIFLAIQMSIPYEKQHPFTKKIIIFPGIIAEKKKAQVDMIFITGGRWGGFGELYPEMLQWANGDVSKIPAMFQEYYNQELIDTFLEDLTKEN